MALTLSAERSCAEALMMACDERLGAQSPAALMVCDTFLARDFWTSFVHQSYLPPVAREIWGWGNNEFTQFGENPSESDWTVSPPRPVSFGSSDESNAVRAMDCGDGFIAVVLGPEGSLWTSGINTIGELGLGFGGSTVSRLSRVETLAGRPVAAVACGSHHTIVLLETGEVLGWGDNSYGQLGVASQFPMFFDPQQLSALNGKPVSKIACRGNFSTALLSTGELFSWGINEYGQLGHGDRNARMIPTQVVALAKTPVKEVFCGFFNAAALLETGVAVAWGYNFSCQLGFGRDSGNQDQLTPKPIDWLQDSDRRAKQIALGSDHTLFLLESGEMFSVGSNSHGQLGVGPSGDSFEPLRLGFFDGKTAISSILCGFNFSAALLQSGALYSWGQNSRMDAGFKEPDCLFSPRLVDIPDGRVVLGAKLSVSFGAALVCSKEQNEPLRRMMLSCSVLFADAFLLFKEL